MSAQFLGLLVEGSMRLKFIYASLMDSDLSKFFHFAIYFLSKFWLMIQFVTFSGSLISITSS